MSQPIRAVYKDGHLWLLDPVHLTEGQEIRLLILSEEERVRAALGDLVVALPTPAEEDVDEEALAREVEAGFRGQPPLSETILEERRAGPGRRTFLIAVRWLNAISSSQGPHGCAR
jgi:predicted DNA-binding antitoxin AbrB/MazE fold protein